MGLQAFTTSQPLTLGVELELQLVSTHDFDRAPQAEDLLRVLENHTGAWDVKPEITRSMIEIGTSIQRQHASLVAELQDLRDPLSRGARKLNIGIGGGGTHAYQHWSQQKIYPGERFNYISELYGFDLAGDSLPTIGGLLILLDVIAPVVTQRALIAAGEAKPEEN